MADTLAMSEEDEATSHGKAMYMVDGYIYKANYMVFVDMDSSCGVESVTI